MLENENVLRWVIYIVKHENNDEVSRLCQGVDCIPNVANTLTRGQVNDVTLAINTVRSGIKKTKRSRKADLNRIEKQKRSILTQIKDYRDSINKKLDDMEKAAKDKLQTKYKKYEDQIKADVKSIEEMIATLETNASELQMEIDGDDESHLFVQVKQSKASTKKGEILMNEMENYVRKEKLLSVEVNRDITDTLCNRRSLFTMSRPDQYNVKIEREKSECHISGLCLLEDGSILITDKKNKTIKKLNQSYKVITDCDLPCEASDVCKTKSTEVAIALLNDKKVQFATVTEKINLTRSFRVGHRCRGLAYSKGELFVSCGGRINGIGGQPQIEVYNSMGILKRTFSKDSTGNSIFSLPLKLTVSLCDTQIHIADYNNGVITMKLDGKQQRVFRDPEFKNATGVCVTDDGSVLVCGLDSPTILQIGTDGQKEAVLLREKDGITVPTSLLYDKANARLIVTMKDSDYINVYDMSSWG